MVHDQVGWSTPKEQPTSQWALWPCVCSVGTHYTANTLVASPYRLDSSSAFPSCSIKSDQYPLKRPIVLLTPSGLPPSSLMPFPSSGAMHIRRPQNCLHCRPPAYGLHFTQPISNVFPARLDNEGRNRSTLKNQPLIPVDSNAIL